jgi:hypothetical protein
MISTRRGAALSVGLAVAGVGLTGGGRAMGCPMHEVAGLAETVTLPPQYAFASGDASAASLAPVLAWKLNLSGAHGTSPDATINSYVSQTLADMQTVQFDSTYAYLKITDVPSHAVGPFVGNPSYPAVQNKTLRIPRSPVAMTGTHTKTGMGPIGVMSNGVYFFNASDAMTYNNAGVWQQNANVVEAASFDAAKGHPAPAMGGTGTPRPGTYHYHQSPTALIEQLDPGNTGQHHSPLIGYAFDGFPIYGPYGYVDPTDPTSGVKKLTSGYKVRDDVLAGTRNTLVDGGATLTTTQRGPAVSATYPAGYYLQDYEWDASTGDLNSYNMRFTKTPEYPDGTWAYFAGSSQTGSIAYPYLIGPEYYGVVDSANLGNGTVTVPAGVTTLKAGDTDADGAVNFADLVVLAQHYKETGATRWGTGDFDRDGKVDFSDLVLLAQNYDNQSGIGDDWAYALSIAPEPTTLGTIAGAAVIVMRRRRANA